MTYPLVLDLADDGIPVTVTCRVLGFSKQAFYKWRADPVSRRDWDDAHLINAAIEIHHDDPEFGTGSSPTSLPSRASTPPATGSTACARRSGCGRSTRASAAWAASQARPCTTTWFGESSPRPSRTSCG